MIRQEVPPALYISSTVEKATQIITGCRVQEYAHRLNNLGKLQDRLLAKEIC